VRQVLDKGHSVVDAAKQLGILDQILYKWVKKLKDANEPVAIDDMKLMHVCCQSASYTMSHHCLCIAK
jgi:transposase